MFRTYRHAELPGNALFGDEIQRWSYIEHGLHRPWFYVTVAEQHEGVTLRNMLMLPSEEVLESLVKQQREELYVESVLLVSPAYINKSERWLMEPLIELRFIKSLKSHQTAYIYYTDEGNEYINNDGKEFKKYSTERIIYSSNHQNYN